MSNLDAFDYQSIKKQALVINQWAKNVYVKIPVENSRGVFMGKVIKELSNNNIKMNITVTNVPVWYWTNTR